MDELGNLVRLNYLYYNPMTGEYKPQGKSFYWLISNMERKLAANIQILKFDVVIVGTGFAGLEAAYGALSVKGKTSIAIVSLQKGPSGSSFQNHNKRVGIQIPLATEEKEYFIKRAIDIGSPGCVTKELVSILMEDIDERFYEIKKIGIDFFTG